MAALRGGSPASHWMGANEAFTGRSHHNLQAGLQCVIFFFFTVQVCMVLLFLFINVALFISLVLFALVFMHLAGSWCVLFVPC